MIMVLWTYMLRVLWTNENMFMVQWTKKMMMVQRTNDEKNMEKNYEKKDDDGLVEK